MVDNVTNHNS